MKTQLLVLVVSIAALLSGCAVGPLVLQESARTVGKGGDELVGGYGQAGYIFKWSHGLSENFDFGLQMESLSLGVRAKYAFINSSSGFSLAAAIGAGSSIGGNHYYADLITSYLNGWWEPYGAVRAVHIKTDPLDFKDTTTGQVDFTVNSFNYDYGQAIIGSRFWLSPSWVLSVEISQLFAITSGVRISDGTLAGAAFGYHF